MSKRRRQIADDLLITELTKARNIYDRGADLESYSQSLIAVTRYLNFLGIPDELLVPLHKLRNKIFDGIRRTKRAGGVPRSCEDSLILATAAGIVTVLKEQGRSVSDAIKAVSSSTGIEQKRIRSFRDNINRGLHDDLAQHLFRLCRPVSRANAPSRAYLFGGVRGFVSGPAIP